MTLGTMFFSRRRPEKSSGFLLMRKRSGHASSSVAAAISTPRLVSLSFFPMLLEEELTVRSITYAASAIIDRLAAPDVPRGSASIEPRSSITGSTA